jgi:hypothetical protein
MPYTKSEAGELLSKAIKGDKIFRVLDRAQKLLKALTLIFFVLLLIDAALTVYAYVSYVAEISPVDAPTLAYLFSSGFGASGASYYSLVLCLLFSWVAGLLLKGLSEIIYSVKMSSKIDETRFLDALYEDSEREREREREETYEETPVETSGKAGGQASVSPEASDISEVPDVTEVPEISNEYPDRGFE